MHIHFFNLITISCLPTSPFLFLTLTHFYSFPASHCGSSVFSLILPCSDSDSTYTDRNKNPCKIVDREYGTCMFVRSNVYCVSFLFSCVRPAYVSLLVFLCVTVFFCGSNYMLLRLTPLTCCSRVWFMNGCGSVLHS